MSPPRKLAIWAAVTVAGVLLPFAPVVLGLRTLSHRDTQRLYAPVRTLVAEALRDGRLPLWNPHEGTGKPLFAEGIHAVLHPVSLVAAAVAPSSIDFLILAYLVTAALGAFALARELGASPHAAASAGLAFALSGFSVSMSGNLVFLAGLSTLPWLVAAARVAGAGSPWGPAAAALATGCAFLSGDVQMALVGLALGSVLAADSGGLRGAARALGAMAVGALLAGVQIAATRELLASVTRGVALEPWELTRWSLAPARLLEWVVPGLASGPLGELPVGRSGARLGETVFSESVFLGAPLVVAAGLGVLRGRRGAGVLLGLSSGVLLWLALGHHLGARQLLDWVPVWGRFRYTEKLMAPLTLCACALGALGIDAFGAGRLSKGWSRALAGAALLSATALAALAGAPETTEALASRLFDDAGTFYRSNLAAGLPQLVVALGVLLAFDRVRGERARASGLALLVALAPAAAVYSGAHLGSPDDGRFTSAMRLDADTPSPRIAQPLERVYLPGAQIDPIGATARYLALLLLPAVNVARRVDTIEPYGAFEPQRLTALANTVGRGWPRTFRRFGLTHVALPLPRDVSNREVTELDVAGGALVQHDEARGFELWAVPHRPWAFFPERAISTDDPKRALALVVALDERRDGSTVVVEASDTPPTGPGRVLHVARGTESVRIEAESLEPALLVVQDAWWPGWRASIDGQPAEILAADYLVRAVRWPAGRHRLELIYDPPGVRLGLALSALGAALVLLLATLGAFRQRRVTAIT